MIAAVALGEIPPHELAWAMRKAGIAAAAAQERGFAELQGGIDASLGPVVRACRELLSCLNQPLQELGPVEVVEGAGALSRDNAYSDGRPLRSPDLPYSRVPDRQLGPVAEDLPNQLRPAWPNKMDKPAGRP